MACRCGRRSRRLPHPVVVPPQWTLLLLGWFALIGRPDGGGGAWFFQSTLAFSTTSIIATSTLRTTTTRLFVKQRKGAKPQPAYRPLHHPQRLRDPLAVERQLLLQQQQQQQGSCDNHHQHQPYFILGSDESGTGAIAGPIVAATCCLVNTKDITTTTMASSSSSSRQQQQQHQHPIPPWLIDGVQDCKRLTRPQKDEIYQQLLLDQQQQQQQQQQDDNNNNNNKPNYLWTVAIRTAFQIDNDYDTVRQANLDAITESTQAMVRLLQEQEQEQHNENDNRTLPISVYSIVDGKHYPKQPKPRPVSNNDNDHNNNNNNSPIVQQHIPGRPWPQGDTIVYTVALASIIAQTIRHQIMEQRAAVQYPQFGFAQHKGYGGHAVHVKALQTHGRTPWHRNSCGDYSYYYDPIRSNNDDKDNDNSISEESSSSLSSASSIVNRRTTIMALLAATATMKGMTASPPAARAMYTDSKTGIRLPEPGEIASAIPKDDWSDMDNPLVLMDNDSSSNMMDSQTLSSPRLSRLDSSNDAVFYQDPRFVEHVDDQAVKLMRQYMQNEVLNRPDTTRLLDLCSSWTSHFPTTSFSSSSKLQRVAGLGMNAQELQANPSLTEWVVQDLNTVPFQRLPYEDKAFDAILCQLSIDYLTQPLQVCREMARTLRPGGTAHILFSNRLFLSKAVALWTGADDIDHAYTVASYFYFCSSKQQQQQLFTSIQAKDLSARNKSGRIVGDPLYVVTAVRA